MFSNVYYLSPLQNLFGSSVQETKVSNGGYATNDLFPKIVGNDWATGCLAMTSQVFNK